MATVAFDNVTKVFEDGTRAVAGLTLGVADGEFVVLVGPSGCGKTTALRLVAGLEDVSDGEIRIGDRVVNDLEPRARDIAMVFQNYALYPHYDVSRNIGFSLEVRRVRRAEIRHRVAETSRVLGLTDFLGRRPRQLSGGQRQRVAMGRAIVRDPTVFLMDEPLSNLDAKLRVQMRAQISRIQRELGATTIYVTHDQVEAMTMGDRVAVLRKGELQQTDEPQRVYDEPANLFVASFIGSPAMSFLEAQVERRGSDVVCRIGEQEAVVRRPELAVYQDRRVVVGIRPEHMRLRRDGEGAVLQGTVLLSESLGPEKLVHIEVAAAPVVRDEVLEGAVELDEAALADLESDVRERRTTLVGRFDSDTSARPGDRIEVAVDTDRVHFFDAETGVAVRSTA
jgi:multiple sugar transport system ATP-binding protein